MSYKTVFPLYAYAALALINVIFPRAVFAHHPMGGAAPGTAWQGFASGIAHPIIGLDHLAFVIAIGFFCALCRVRNIGFPVALISASVLGSLVRWNEISIFYGELFVAVSVLVAGVFLLLRTRKMIAFSGIATIGALFHGFAYGEAVIGAESTHVIAYLFGLSLIQITIALTVYGLADRLIKMHRKDNNSIWVTSGAGVSLVGMAHLALLIAA
ncbi:hypothetical protein HC341_03845 [Aquisalimonas sp. 2447]|uniref:HupE/UreJ family protein n=1 Tax=Aquisalimonas sp. 2447 TaxID=2740807 RepID=UPI0014325448|nr:HupE/UreJ family protein [Aquisalimonas sp. 2447]QIT54424.1 hypothetical protein HC341_03845 [Aquisalimonas sp. 2447]